MTHKEQQQDRDEGSHRRACCLSEGDHVANVLDAVVAGDSVVVSGAISDTDSGKAVVPGSAVSSGTLLANEDIRRFHKIAMTDLAMGEAVVRDGYVIGVARCAIARGDWVHIHNIKSQRA